MTTLDFAAPVKSLIPHVEERMRSQSNGYHAELAAALEQLISAGGKRVRPKVALLSAGMLGVDEERAVTFAAAVELLHTATLVHDDFIDDALTRRGEDTLNAHWSASATILAGDFLFSQAAWLASEVDSIDVMQMFAKTLATIVNGEIGQIFSHEGISSPEQYYERIYAKTASMFELAAGAPTFIAEGGDRYREDLINYGYEIGMAFQIVDDVLDFSEDETRIGKPVGHDLRQGLVTLPTLFYLEGEPNNALVAKLVQGEEVGDAEFDKLLADIRAAGAVQRALEKGEEHSRNALDMLSKLPDGPERQALADLSEYVVARLH